MRTVRAELAHTAAKLAERGTRLRPPADGQTLAKLEAVLKGRLSEQARSLFSTFDGFADEMADHETMVCLWSVDAIIQRIEQSKNIGVKQVVGDHFLGADLLCCDLLSDSSEVLWAENGSVAAKSLLDLCRKIGEGTFGP